MRLATLRIKATFKILLGWLCDYSWSQNQMWLYESIYQLANKHIEYYFNNSFLDISCGIDLIMQPLKSATTLSKDLK